MIVFTTLHFPVILDGQLVTVIILVLFLRISEFYVDIYK
jgi:hypothetical protein